MVFVADDGADVRKVEEGFSLAEKGISICCFEADGKLTRQRRGTNQTLLGGLVDDSTGRVG